VVSMTFALLAAVAGLALLILGAGIGRSLAPTEVDLENRPWPPISP
jgi:hypothetical protein